MFGTVTSGMDVVDLIELTETNTVGEYDDVPVTPIIIRSVQRILDEKRVDEKDVNEKVETE